MVELAQVLRTDFGLLGVVLNAGEHTVELRYRPPFLYAGVAVSLRVPRNICSKSMAVATNSLSSMMLGLRVQSWE